MSRKKRYIELTPEQKVALELAYKTGHSHDFRTRCHCILLSAEKWSVNELIDFFKVSRISIYKWFNRYEAEGIEGLKIRPGRGRKRKLDLNNAEHVKLVKASLSKENRSIKQLREELESLLGIQIGDTTLRDFLKVLVTDIDDSDSALNQSKILSKSLKR